MDNCKDEVISQVDLDYFKALFEPVRNKIIQHLTIYGSQSIQQISESFSQDRSVISRHLEILFKQGVVKKRKESRFTYYSVDPLDIAKKLEETAKDIRFLVEKYQC